MANVTVSAGIAYGVPVSPDRLGQSLEAYERFLPTLTTLRWCRRFGHGDSGAINELPVEILSIIEGHVFEFFQAECTSWLTQFRHFESRREPADHKLHDWIYENVIELASNRLCDECLEEFSVNGCDDVVCQGTKHHYLNALAIEDADWHMVECARERTVWGEMIDQRPGGQFQKYGQLLRKHFGLEAYFATTRITYDQPAPWPQHPSHQDHSYYAEPQTTLCYVILPIVETKDHTYALNLSETDDATARIDGSLSALVKLPSLNDGEKRAKQFGHMLRSLNLEPYVHESQRDNTVIVDATEKEIDALSHSGAVLEKTEWPQLVLLVKTHFDPWGGS